MNTIGHMLLAALLGLSALGQADEAGKSPAVLLQEAIYQEETAGDLDKAIELYGQVLEQAADVERLAARAAYQLGLCHLKKGDEATAAQYFRKAGWDYPNQTAIVKKAQAELDKIAPKEPKESVFDKIGMQAIRFIAEQYGITAMNAYNQNLNVNGHVYYADSNGDKYSGGLNSYYNWTGRTITQKVKLTSMTGSDYTFYDASGQELNVEFKINDAKTNHYFVYWTPEEPLEPQQFLYYGWSSNSKQKMTNLPGERYTLKMQNHFGDAVLETFYLVLPKNMKIIYNTTPPTGSEKLLELVVYWWTKQVPEGENHEETVSLEKVDSLAENTDQLILEDSFEEGSDGTPAGWEKDAAVEGVSYVWDKNTGRDGAASLCLKKDVEKYFPIAQWTRKIEYTGDAKELTVSAQVRARKAYKAVIDALFLDDKGEWIKHEWVSYIGVKEAGDPPANHNWTDYSGTVQIPDNTNTIVIGLQMYGPGTVWFDELNAAYTDGTQTSQNTPSEETPDPLKAEDLVAEGWNLWQQRKLAEAEDKFKEAVFNSPDNDGAWQGLGWAQLNQGKKQNAEASFKKCVKLNSQNSAALNGLGWIAHGQNEKAEAVKWWEKAVQAQPGATAALSGLTQTYMETEQFDKAVQYYEMWLNVEPNNQDVKNGLEKAKQALK